jgi:hypothetical protein
MASNRGPNATQPYAGGGGITSNTGSVGGSWGNTPGQSYTTPSVTINSVPGSSNSGGGTAVSDGTYEKNLILELCPPGGMKPVPPPDKLANFARTCASLNSDLVCPVLLDCLEEGQPWVIRAKALCTMEAAISNGTKVDGTNPYRDFFFACRDEISPLISHPRPPINEPAQRVLKLLGVSPDAMPSVALAPPISIVQPPNLLDFDDVPVQDTPAPAAAPPPPIAPNTGSMFGGMQVKSSPAPPQPHQAIPVAAPPVGASSANLLDFDPAPVVTQQPTANDAFPTATSTASSTTQQASSVSTTTSMFDQLSVKEADTKKDNDISSVVNNGSAFGFMNSGDAAGVVLPPPQSFDPLKNNTHTQSPNPTQKKMMEMSPEQIQAMAYQQMMMQQQMQMMMQQQQMGGGVVPMPVGMVGGGMPMYPPLGGMQGVRRTPSLGSPNAPTMPAAFSFAPKPAQKDDKKFDFVKDAMAGHKK